MLGLSFNPFKSKTAVGAFLAVLAYLSQPEVFAVLPEKVGVVVGAIGAFLTALGLRDAVASNGVGSSPEIADEKNGTRGFAVYALLVGILLVGCAATLGTAAVTAGGPDRDKPQLERRAPEVSAALSLFADSVVAVYSCGDNGWRNATAVVTCEWQTTKDGAAIATPDGFTARYVFAGAPGDSATYVATARGKNAIGSVGPWSAPLPWKAVLGFPTITAPVLTIVVSP